MSITLDDVAAKAGVSRALVSLALRDSPKVSKRSRERVQAAATALGYRPNIHARRLASGRTGTVGVLISDLYNPVHAEILDAFADRVSMDREEMLLASAFRNAARERAAFESFLSARVDAVVIVGPEGESSAILALSQQVPTIVVGRRVRGVHSVVIDDRLGSQAAVEHLIGLGHRDIAHLDGGKGAGASIRRRAYVDTMTAHGLGGHVRVCAGDYSEESGQSGFEKMWAGPKPSAIFAANDMSALGVLSGARAAGVAVCEELSVVGFDNTTLARSALVSLTSVDYPKAQMGVAAADILARTMAEKGVSDAAQPGPDVIVLPPRLIARATTGPVRRGS